MQCRSCGKPGTETCSDCYGEPMLHTPKELPKCKTIKDYVNLGAIRVMMLRALQVVQVLMVLFLYLGISGKILIITILAFGYTVLDYLVIYPQEQEYALKKNKELLRLLKERNEC